jgi:hypothetical protein
LAASAFTISFMENTTAIIVQSSSARPRPLQFAILLFVTIISIPCFAFVLFHILAKRALYSALNNHVIILLLVSNAIQTVTDVPLQLIYWYTGVIWPQNLGFCLFLYFIDLYFFTSSLLLLTWASFERHILIFRSQFFNVPFRRLIGHYIPLGFCYVYPLIYYVVFFFCYPCENYYDMTWGDCFGSCYLWESSFMALYEQIVHGFLPMLCIIVFNILLIIRVLEKRRRMGRQLTWATNRRMALQLLGVCFLVVILNSGYFVIQIGQLLTNISFGKNVATWVFPLSLFMPPLMSYMCLNTVPNLRTKLRRIVFCGHPRAVAPIVTKTIPASEMRAATIGVPRHGQ